jgi:hypothetical protein
MSKRDRVVEIAVSLVGRGSDCCASAAPGYNLTIVSWCQIFWLHCLRAAGVTDLVWSDLVRRGWVHGWLLQTDDPQPGDLGYIDQPWQHGAVVRRVVGDTVWTVDGNMWGEGGKRVREKMRKRSEFTTFYSIAQLLPDVAHVGESDLDEPAQDDWSRRDDVVRS